MLIFVYLLQKICQLGAVISGIFAATRVVAVITFFSDKDVPNALATKDFVYGLVATFAAILLAMTSGYLTKKESELDIKTIYRKNRNARN